MMQSDTYSSSLRSNESNWTGDCISLPSCIESIVNSAEQLRELAYYGREYYLKVLLSFAYAAEFKDFDVQDHDIASLVCNWTKRSLTIPRSLEASKPKFSAVKDDPKVLGCMHSTSQILAFLRELSSFVERCSTTIDLAFRRSAYFFDLGIKNRTKCVRITENDDDFLLPTWTRMDPIFVALVDLVFVIVSIDLTIREHSKISEKLETFKAACQLAVDSPEYGNFDHIDTISKEQLAKLIEFVATIQFSLCDTRQTILQQCNEHLYHLNINLSAGMFTQGYNAIGEHLEEYIKFYSTTMIDTDRLKTPKLSTEASKAIYLINTNVIPSMFMTTTHRRLFGLVSLCIVYCWMFKDPERTISKILVQTLQKFKIIDRIDSIGTNSYFSLREFAAKHLIGSSLDPKIVKQIQNFNYNLTSPSISDLKYECIALEISNWLVKFNQLAMKLRKSDYDLLEHNDSSEVVRSLKYGIELAEAVNSSIQASLAMLTSHSKNISPLDRSTMTKIRSIPLLKSMLILVHEQDVSVREGLAKFEIWFRSKWLHVMSKMRNRLLLTRVSKLDMTSVMLLTDSCSNIEAAASSFGRFLLSLCLSILLPSLETGEMAELNKLLHCFPPFDAVNRLDKAVDCSYMFWNLSLVGPYYNYLFEDSPCSSEEISHFHIALNDIPNLFKPSCFPPWLKLLEPLNWLDARRAKYLKNLEDELMDQFKQDFLDRLCQEVEIELRIQAHFHLYPSRDSSFKSQSYNFNSMLMPSKCNRTHRIFGRSVSLRHHVESHLSRIFYNLVSISPHDWTTYEHMMNLAHRRYNMKIANPQLPMQEHGSGSDLLDIVRNLGSFTLRFGFDQVNQMFIEKFGLRLTSSTSASIIGQSESSILPESPSSNFHQNRSASVVQVSHFVRSIQTHGYGILNSSVNRIYLAMKRLFNALSKRLSDDRLRAILVNENQRLGCPQSGRFDFDRANRMAKRFRQRSSVIGGSEENQIQQSSVAIDLNSIRQSTIQLGNLLALIRMIKTSALNCASKSAAYLPDLDRLSSSQRFSELLKDELSNASYNGLDELSKAALNLDACISNLNANFMPQTNYFRIILGLFSDALCKSHSEVPGNRSLESQSEEQANSEHKSDNPATDLTKSTHEHLKLFHVLVPALTINFIDYIINCKERASSRSASARFGALASDDGFSMGLAFILTVLRQVQDFSRFEWFKQVHKKLDDDILEVEIRMGDSKLETSLKQTSTMTVRRLKLLKLEYEGLDCSFNSNLLFFGNTKD